jgi:hypothetical protein
VREVLGVSPAPYRGDDVNTQNFYIDGVMFTAVLHGCQVCGENAITSISSTDGRVILLQGHYPCRGD